MGRKQVVAKIWRVYRKFASQLWGGEHINMSAIQNIMSKPNKQLLFMVSVICDRAKFVASSVITFLGYILFMLAIPLKSLSATIAGVMMALFGVCLLSSTKSQKYWVEKILND